MSRSRKQIVLAPSAGGKSTLMRYLREHTDFNVLEMDEEVMKENGDKWPDDNNYKDQVLVPMIVKKILKEDDVLYLASYVPEELLVQARSSGFEVLLLNVGIAELNRRNKVRMDAENYADASPWIKQQLNSFTKLKDRGLIDKIIDGNQDTKSIVDEIKAFTSK